MLNVLLLSGSEYELASNLVWVFPALGFFYYFIPSLLGRKKANSQSIFLVNLLLGWTIIGWAYALIMALRSSSSLLTAHASEHPQNNLIS